MPQNSSSLSTQGQRHDRIEHHGVAFGEPDDDEGDLSISLGQKMLSAISGSLITSLLGKSASTLQMPLLTVQSDSTRCRKSEAAISSSSSASYIDSTTLILLHKPSTQSRHHLVLSRSVLGVQQHRILCRHPCHINNRQATEQVNSCVRSRRNTENQVHIDY